MSVRPREPLPPADTGGTVHVEMPGDVDFLDPGLAYLPGSWQVLHSTCAKLLNYPDGSGASGGRLVPELAEGFRSRSGGGRTYTFTVRRGFRFSPPSGEPVTAQSMKYTIERSLDPRMRSAAPSLVSDVKSVRASGEDADGDAHAPLVDVPELDLPSVLRGPARHAHRAEGLRACRRRARTT